jgi:hypothetical protein
MQRIRKPKLQLNPEPQKMLHKKPYKSTYLDVNKGYCGSESVKTVPESENRHHFKALSGFEALNSFLNF